MDKNIVRFEGIKKHFVLVSLLTIVQVIALIFQAIYLAEGIVGLYKGTAVNAVLPSFYGFVGMFSIRHLIQWVKEKICYRFANQTANELQKKLVEKVFQLGPKAIGKRGSGDMITLTLEGIPSFRTYIELFIPRTISIVITPIIVLFYFFQADLGTGLILMIVLPISIIFLILIGILSQKKMDAQWETYQLLSRHFVDSLRGLVTLKYLGKSKNHRKSIQTVSDKYRIATNRTLRLAFASSFSLDFFASLSVAVVAVELGLRLINGNMDLQLALTLLILAPDYFLPIRELGNDYHATMDGKEALKTITDFLDQKQEEKKEIPISKWNETSSLIVSGLQKHIKEEDRFILKDIHFHVNGYKKIGIVGMSGAGKSTLTDIITGFTLPTDGQIIINGQVTDHFAHTNWQEQLSYIPQHPYIFAATVEENIRFYKPDATIEEVKEAAHRAGLTELINELPNGYNELIGQGGRVLSGGEEQRLALARTLLQERPIMIFDEPTAHLDIETEHEIKEIMLPLLENKLVFFTTHRLHWMREMEQIIVLKNGEIEAIGKHEDLYRDSKAYKELIDAQLGGGNK